MITPEMLQTFTPLEIVLFGVLVAMAGGIVTVTRYFYLYMKHTNKERAEEIRMATQVQTELIQTIKHNCDLMDKLPERLTDKIQIAVNSKTS